MPERHARAPRRARLRRLLGLGIVLVSILMTTTAAPAIARAADAKPTVAVATRHGATRSAVAVRVDARAAARAAASHPRAQRTLSKLRADVGAARGAKVGQRATGVSRLAAGSSSFGSTASGPRLVAGTTEQQVVSNVPGIEQADTCSCEPPDPWIAVSPSHVVQSTNGKVRISNRAGTELVSMPAWGLFAVPANRFDSDPRIVWDAVHARWVGVITSYSSDFTDNGLRVAISDTSDPTGSWVVYAIDTFEFLPDYPGLASSSTKIVLSSDDFLDLDPDPELASFEFEGPTLYVIDWSSILASGVVPVGAYFDGPDRAHFRPAQMLSSGTSVPVIFEDQLGHVGYLAVTQTAAAITAIDPGTISAFDLTAAGPGIVPFVAPTTQPTQPGGVEIDGAADERPTDAVYRNGHLWFVATTDYFDGVDHWAAGRWTEVLTSATNVLPTQATDWVTVSPHHFFSGGMVVSGNGTTFFVASRTDASEFPTSVVAAVLPNGANLGTTVQDFIPIESSTEAYTGSRWGDYLGVAADPSYSGAVWVEHELVAAGGGWRTSVARIVSDATVPTAPGAVSQSIVTSTSLSRTAAVKVSWGAATDAGSGVAKYLVERSDGLGGFFGVTTTGTSITQPLIVGVQYQYRISAIDTVGNVSPVRVGPLYRVTLYQSTQQTVYSTGWGSSSSASYSGGSTKYSSTAGKTATFTATSARSIAIVATKATSRGSFKVYVDGVLKKTISTYATSTKFRQLVYQVSWTTAGTHKIKVVISGTSGHPRVDLDAFVVLR